MTDNRMIIATVVGTGIAMTTVIVAFIGIIASGITTASTTSTPPSTTGSATSTADSTP